MKRRCARLLVRKFSHGIRDLCFVIGATFVMFGCVRDESPGAGEGKMSPGVRSADNSECLICHMDFKAEELAAKHEKEGLGCTSCHGPSLAHGDDELNITPPDRLFGRAEIVRFCKDCHRRHVKGKAYDEFVEKWHSKRRPNGRMILDDSVCTDCHGDHAVLRIDQQQMIPEG